MSQNDLSKQNLKEPLILGLLLFIAASMQQIGMLWTSAGSAGFITGLYIVFVPLTGLFRRQKLSGSIILAILLSIIGLWLMNQSAELNATLGNLIILIGAFFWALHVQQIDKLTKSYNSLDLAIAQFTVCAVLSAMGAVIYRFVMLGWSAFDQTIVKGIVTASVPLLYAGFMSVGIAFTLQLYAQKRVHPHTASVILCLESVFAMLGGYLLLKESVTASAIAGAGFLLAAMVVSIVSDRRDLFLIDKNAAPQI